MIIEYSIALIASLAIDGLWLGIISKPIYQKYIGELMLKQANIVPAIIFYLIFAAAIVVFVTSPALKSNWGLGAIIFHGALLGLVIYGGYDLTNLAVLKGWSLAISAIDIAWGVTLASAVSLLTVFFSKLFIN